MATFSAKVTDLSALDTGADEEKRTPLSESIEKGLHGVEGGEANEESQDGSIPFFKKPLFLGISGLSAVALFSLIFALTRGRGSKVSNESSPGKIKPVSLFNKASVSTTTKASFIPSMMKRPVVLASVAGVALVALGIMIYLVVSRLDEEEIRRKEELLKDKLRRDEPLAAQSGWLDLQSTKSLVLAGALLIATLTSVIGLVGYRKGWFSKTAAPLPVHAPAPAPPPVPVPPPAPQTHKTFKLKWGDCIEKLVVDLADVSDLESLIDKVNTEDPFGFRVCNILHSNKNNITESLEKVNEAENLIVVPVKDEEHIPAKFDSSKERKIIFVMVKNGKVDKSVKFDNNGKTIIYSQLNNNLTNLFSEYNETKEFFNVIDGEMEKFKNFYFSTDFKGLPIYVKLS